MNKKYYINPFTGRTISSSGRVYNKLKIRGYIPQKDSCFYNQKSIKECVKKIHKLYGDNVFPPSDIIDIPKLSPTSHIARAYIFNEDKTYISGIVKKNGNIYKLLHPIKLTKNLPYVYNLSNLDLLTNSEFISDEELIQISKEISDTEIINTPPILIYNIFYNHFIPVRNISIDPMEVLKLINSSLQNTLPPPSPLQFTTSQSQMLLEPLSQRTRTSTLLPVETLPIKQIISRPKGEYKNATEIPLPKPTESIKEISRQQVPTPKPKPTEQIKEISRQQVLTPKPTEQIKEIYQQQVPTPKPKPKPKPTEQIKEMSRQQVLTPKPTEQIKEIYQQQVPTPKPKPKPKPTEQIKEMSRQQVPTEEIYQQQVPMEEIYQQQVPMEEIYQQQVPIEEIYQQQVSRPISQQQIPIEEIYQQQVSRPISQQQIPIEKLQQQATRPISKQKVTSKELPQQVTRPISQQQVTTKEHQQQVIIKEIPQQVTKPISQQQVTSKELQQQLPMEEIPQEESLNDTLSSFYNKSSDEEEDQMSHSTLSSFTDDVRAKKFFIVSSKDKILGYYKRK